MVSFRPARRAQTCDAHMITNRGKFAQNGRAGYLLKPAYLLPAASPALPVDANAKATFAGDGNQVRCGFGWQAIVSTNNN